MNGAGNLLGELIDSDDKDSVNEEDYDAQVQEEMLERSMPLFHSDSNEIP